MDIKNNNQQFGPLEGAKTSSVENETPKKGNYRMIIITVVVLFIGISGFLVLTNANIKQQLIGRFTPNVGGGGAARDNNSVPVPTGDEKSIDKNLPWIDIVSAEPGQTYSTADTVTLYVDASSGTADITGFDVLINMDKEYFELVDVTSELPNFQIFKFNNENHVSVTGIKDIEDQGQSIFENARLLKLTLKPKKSGTSTVSIVPAFDKEVTQLVDVNVQVVKPQAGSEQVTVN